MLARLLVPTLVALAAVAPAASASDRAALQSTDLIYTDARRITLAQSVAEKGVPAGGDNGTMSYYANYVVFDSPAPIGAGGGPRQIYLRYLGPV
jgi:hypothetical protein